MKQIIIVTVLTLALYANTTAQTNATNWTAQDCNSNSHTLFNELDNGKIIVMAWVMPCGSCVNGAKAAYNVVQSYATSNPGKVLFYIADDMGDATCTQLTNWITTNNIGDINKMTIFSNSGNLIKESDFGGSGMPHVVVMAGNDHKIFFNKLNANANDPTGIQAAVSSAFAALNVDGIEQVKFAITPNPVSTNISITSDKAIEKITILSVAGQVIKEEIYPAGKMNPTLNFSGVASGVYTIWIIDIEGKSGIQKIVKE